MKTIGFIDYYIDEWHAQNYPAMIQQSTRGDDFRVTLAWQKIQPDDKETIEAFCAKHGIEQAASLEQVVDACDCLVVLSPDNAEMHEELADLPLRSGKPVYIDKPIAPDLAAARRLLDKAAKHDTPMFSSSALRFGSGLEQLISETLQGRRVEVVTTRGGGQFDTYAIHQLEMVVAVLGAGATRAMQVGTAACPVIAIEYADGRRAAISLIPGQPFQLAAGYVDGDAVQAASVEKMDDFFPRFIEAMLRFFDTGEPQAPPAETLQIAALIEAGAAALKRPAEWVDVPAV